MTAFQHILYVRQVPNPESHALAQALMLASKYKARLTALLIYPPLPEPLHPMQSVFESALREHLTASIARFKAGCSIPDGVEVDIQISAEATPSVGVIQHVMKNGHDLLIKETEPNTLDTGFMALDMALIRQCPCPVWLCRPQFKSDQEVRLAVAIDPEADTPEGQAHGLTMLKLARALADTYNGELTVISCWDYKYEHYLKSNVWIKVSDEELAEHVAMAKQQHYQALQEQIKASSISGSTRILHVKGAAEEMIPKTIEQEHIDILVMGTVGRTGIKGFIIGNTAENIVQKLGSSLLAMKPEGFVSPVHLAS